MLNEPQEKLVSNAAHTTQAVVFEAPKRLELRELELRQPEAGQVRVDVEWSGISTGTEKLLWDGAMPPFPGMGYPLVPGYETVGRVVQVGANTEKPDRRARVRFRGPLFRRSARLVRRRGVVRGGGCRKGAAAAGSPGRGSHPARARRNRPSRGTRAHRRPI